MKTCLALVLTAAAAVALRTQAAEIHDAARRNAADRIRTLLAADPALVNSVDEEGNTPLHCAAEANAADACSELISRGARTDARNAGGLTPFQAAVRRGASSAVEIMVKRTPAVYRESSLDAEMDRSQKALGDGYLLQAYNIFNVLLKKDPGNENVNFGLGLVCRSLGDLGRARMAFERVLQINPANDRARFELARLLIERREIDAARGELETILSHGVKDGDVRARIEAMLAEIGRGKGNWQVGGRVEVGVFRDDNVNIGPDSENVRIAPIIFGSTVIESLSVQESSRPREADGAYLMALATGTRDMGAPGGWAVACSGGGYANALDGEHEGEVMYAYGGAGLRFSGDRAAVHVPFSAAHISSGREPLANTAGLAPALTVAVGRKSPFLLTTSAGVDYRDYDEYDARDGFYLSAGETIRHVSQDGKSTVAFGVSVFRDNADEGIYCADGLAWYMSGEAKIPGNFTLYARLRFLQSDYDEKETLAPERRSDRQRQFTVGINRRIVGNAGIDINHQYTSNESTFDLYQYTRRVTTAGVFFAF